MQVVVRYCHLGDSYLWYNSTVAACNVIHVVLCTPLIGAKPFSDVAIGASLDPFIQHLKEGNKPPQPTGLSDSM